jgi:SAM-dependent methyltransferase
VEAERSIERDSVGGPGQRPSYYTSGTGLADHIAARTAAVEAAFFLPYLRPGMTLLDCGCGPGTITLGLAEAVAPASVTGIDLDASIIETARANAARRDLANVRFEVGDVYELPFPNNHFDAAFENNMFMHLKEPLRAMREILRVLKPGGVVGCRNPAADKNLIGTSDPTVRKAARLWERWSKYRLRSGAGGSDYRIGGRLCSLLLRAGFAQVQAEASYDNLRPPMGVEWYSDVMASRFERSGPGSIADAAARLGWADPQTIAELAVAWREWGSRSDSYAAAAYVGVIGWKSQP